MRNYEAIGRDMNIICWQLSGHTYFVIIIRSLCRYKFINLLIHVPANFPAYIMWPFCHLFCAWAIVALATHRRGIGMWLAIKIVIELDSLVGARGWASSLAGCWHYQSRDIASSASNLGGVKNGAIISEQLTVQYGKLGQCCNVSERILWYLPQGEIGTWPVCSHQGPK